LLANNESAGIEWNRNFFIKRRAEQNGNRTINLSEPKPRTTGSMGIVGITFWQIFDGWKDVYRSSQGVTRGLTVSVSLIPLFVIWSCSRRNEESDEGAEEEEEEVEKEQWQVGLFERDIVGATIGEGKLFECYLVRRLSWELSKFASYVKQFVPNDTLIGELLVPTTYGYRRSDRLPVRSRLDMSKGKIINSQFETILIASRQWN
jgi:hypothetical protein